MHIHIRFPLHFFLLSLLVLSSGSKIESFGIFLKLQIPDCTLAQLKQTVLGMGSWHQHLNSPVHDFSQNLGLGTLVSFSALLICVTAKLAAF